MGTPTLPHLHKLFWCVTSSTYLSFLKSLKCHLCISKDDVALRQCGPTRSVLYFNTCNEYLVPVLRMLYPIPRGQLSLTYGAFL